MQTRIYHGEITPQQAAQALIGHFHRGNLIAQQFGDEDEVIVQVRTRRHRTAGGQTALTITLKAIEDGVAVQVGKQAWLGVAASLGVTALATLKNPFNLVGRLDDLAQDFESLKISEQVWEVLDAIARFTGASHQISERLRRLSCGFCRTANPVGQSNCVACGAPLGDQHPTACPHCGYVLPVGLETCPNCKNKVVSP